MGIKGVVTDRCGAGIAGAEIKVDQRKKSIFSGKSFGIQMISMIDVRHMYSAKKGYTLKSSAGAACSNLNALTP